MQLVNETQFAAGWTMGFARDGRELVVVAIKGTFAIPDEPTTASLAARQIPLTESDEFSGEPGFSAPVRESDYGHHKPMCDVLVNATAYAPEGNRASKLTVGVRVASMVKTFSVVGDRIWLRGMTGDRASDPRLFDVMPISYANAYGGVDETHGDDRKTFLENPIGRGFCHFKDRVEGILLPNTEELDRPLSRPGGTHKAMSFGPVGRNWRPRAQYAGTYDEPWLQNEAPFWPRDFDYRYFQAAPADQQIPYPLGGEEVALQNLTPNGFVSFRLPTIAVPVWFQPYRGKDTQVEARLDTISLEPDLGYLTLTWRAAQPMRRNCFEIKRVVAGALREPAPRLPSRRHKPYYHGLAELIRAKQQRRHR